MQTSPKQTSKIMNTGKVPGNKVRHKTFGSGIIVKRSGDSLEIAFEKIGLKTIKESFVEEL